MVFPMQRLKYRIAIALVINPSPLSRIPGTTATGLRAMIASIHNPIIPSTIIHHSNSLHQDNETTKQPILHGK
jgi:hypothetical protein